MTGSRLTGIAVALVACSAVSALTIDFDDYTITEYAGSAQNPTGDMTVEVLDDGATLKMTGNGWRKIELPAAWNTITADTVVSLDFRSDVEGEIHGIILAVTNDLEEGRAFQFFGTQSWGNQTYNTYATTGTWKSYTIPVGQHYTGTANYLAFIGDHDVSSPNAVGYYRNVRIVPEPATAALLAVGFAGLGVLRRRRR